MKRLQLFEFCDLSGWPSLWKDLETDYLSLADRFLDLYRPAVTRLGQALKETRCHNLVDLCSGGARHLVRILHQIEDELHWNVRVTLTDLYPNVEAYRRAQSADARIGYVKTPTDATAVRSDLKGFRTMFAGLHHFKPDLVRRILGNAVESGEGVAIFEHTNRSLIGVASMLATPLLVWLLTPLARPLTVSRLFWTYVVPVIPAMVLWDGLVSGLRSYTPEELKAFVRPLARPDYRWDVEQFRVWGIIRITLLLGSPVDAADSPIH